MGAKNGCAVVATSVGVLLFTMPAFGPFLIRHTRCAFPLHHLPWIGVLEGDPQLMLAASLRTLKTRMMWKRLVSSWNKLVDSGGILWGGSVGVCGNLCVVEGGGTFRAVRASVGGEIYAESDGPWALKG